MGLINTTMIGLVIISASIGVGLLFNAYLTIMVQLHETHHKLIGDIMVIFLCVVLFLFACFVVEHGAIIMSGIDWISF
jgi:F0F1-type ATP synthase membrane subunit c/vacuolar-type H+-ATPase subunit K